MRNNSYYKSLFLKKQQQQKNLFQFAASKNTFEQEVHKKEGYRPAAKGGYYAGGVLLAHKCLET